MKIKYEAVFGPQHLFKLPSTEIIVVGPHGDKTESNIDLMIGNTPDDYVIIAMRRIIKEPKRWTWEDKEAGRLPEVGWLVYSENDSKSALVIAKDHEGDIWFQCSCGVVRCTDGYVMLPIETPAEKAQREENEFVKSEMKDTTLSIELACIYERGVRAAYRKLKVGE